MGFKSILLAIPFDKRFKGGVSAIKRYVFNCVITASHCQYITNASILCYRSFFVYKTRVQVSSYCYTKSKKLVLYQNYSLNIKRSNSLILND